MRVPRYRVLNDVGRKLIIYIIVCLLFLCVSVHVHRTSRVLRAYSVDKFFFIQSHKQWRSPFKKSFIFKKYKHDGKVEVDNWEVRAQNGDLEEGLSRVQGDVAKKEERKEEVNGGEAHGKRFADVPEISQKIVHFLEGKGIKYMTKIQSQSFKPIYEGSDIIGRSETGSGKTLAFALPLVEKLYKQKMERKRECKIEESQMDNEDCNFGNTDNLQQEGKGPSILVLEPTRELSKQVENTFKEISQFYDFNVMSIYGGESYTYQESKLRRGVEIITGTPGRIIDHLERKNLSLQSIKFLVLDEADEMLNLGFTHDIERILSYIDLKKAQVLLYSATTPSWIKDISSKYLKNPFFIDVIDSSNKTSKNIQHIAIKTPYDIKEKAMLLEDIILVNSNGGQVIIFTRTKLEADILCSEGSFKSLSFSVLHGNIAQTTREHTMQRFRSGMFQILIATDIASRGLDVSNVDLVIQCFPPNYSAIYIHRAGRTGRANKKGISIVLFSNEDKQDLLKIEKNCGIKFSIEQLPKNEDVFDAACNIASKKIENVNTDILPFFLKSANEIMEKYNAIHINNVELIARCLAIITKKEHVKKRSLINGLSETLTLNLVNKNRKWKNENDIIFWVNKISNELNVNTFNKILQVKINNKDRSSSFFDLNEHLAELFVQNFNNMSKRELRNMFHLSLAQNLPDNVDLSSDSYSTSRYQPRRKSYSYRRRPSYT
ncbi:ATP-dependent helicase, putative [Plasmodium ovale]|uniref:RNA helicase n=1 Tax=Plasmodium ovale TaxID=36330 RepID=A0A1D3U8Z6_PLAOA|nr:ATP-dependent helicase, putative [Plasmodium ovale]